MLCLIGRNWLYRENEGSGVQAQKALPRRLAAWPRCNGYKRRPQPTVKLGNNGTTPFLVPLTGRATSVPFTTDLAGPERTSTDSTPAPSTCAVRHPRR